MALICLTSVFKTPSCLPVTVFHKLFPVMDTEMRVMLKSPLEGFSHPRNTAWGDGFGVVTSGLLMGQPQLYQLRNRLTKNLYLDVLGIIRREVTGTS